MHRSFVAVVVIAVASIVTLGSLAFVWASPGPHKASARAEGDWRILDPVTYENISIFPVVSGSSQDTSSFLTLEEGLASGEVIVSERGATGMVRRRGDVRPIAVPQYASGASVNQLVLINRSKRPLLLLAGELVSGGKQDRIIGKDRIVPVGADPLPLDVFCVEHGRWTGSSSQFSASNTIVHPSVRERAAVEQKQTEVWAAVTGGSTARPSSSLASRAPAPRVSAEALADAISSEAPTQSYRKIYESTRIGGSVDSFVDQVQRRFARATSGLKAEHVVGVIVAYGGEVAWSDIFASDALFRQYWSKLLRSYAVEALARPTLRETASVDDAREFLRRPNGREVQETEAGVYRWREITEGQLALIELDALQPKSITLHRLLLRRTS
jgi:ARG and Rhodanese-Phosphatase-superfamily-associated Protein domain